MAYGLRLGDGSNTKTLTPDDMTIISAGSVSMPAALNGDNTYGTDIDLPGVASIPVANLAVLVVPRRPSFKSIFAHYVSNNIYWGDFHYADGTATYYTRNESTGVMTSWSAGSASGDSFNDYDGIISVFPIAFWDKMGATTFTAIRLFAATCYLVRDGSDGGNPISQGSSYGTNKTVYTIASNGVSTVDYLIGLKKWDY